ncbi:MAG TPA: M23 family metallopeptidase [Kofleriaceae bacterium]|nr:M23 family metallopeptidase [Kofleriaceae bacterium]
MGARGSCSGCGEELALHRARPVIGPDGTVGTWCDGCWARRHERPRARTATAAPMVESIAAPSHRLRRPTVTPVEAPIAAESRWPRLHHMVMSSAAVVVASVGVLVLTQRAKVTAAAVPVPAIEPDTRVDELQPRTPRVVPTRPAAGPIDLGPELDLDSLEEQRPTLLDWVHPITGTDERVPARRTARFGAQRYGIVPRTECGDGHCGIDLGGPRGRPVVAVAWGTVSRVDHSRDGRDGRSGRYVRIEHPDGVFTSYMHLDAIVAGLKVGDEVEPGQVIGTLGKTAIRHGVQHVHFSLELEQGGAIVYTDPARFLERSQVLPIPDGPLELVPAAPDDPPPADHAGEATSEATGDEHEHGDDAGPTLD